MRLVDVTFSCVSYPGYQTAYSQLMFDVTFSCVSYPGYQTAYSQLMFAGKKEHDPCGPIPDVKINLAKSLHKLSTGRPGTVSIYLTQTDDDVAVIARPLGSTGA